MSGLRCETCGVETDAIRCDDCEQKRRDAWWAAAGEADLWNAFNQKPWPDVGSVADRALNAGRLVAQLAYAVAFTDRQPHVARVLYGFADRLQKDVYREGVGLLNIANVGRQAHDYIRARAPFKNAPFEWPAAESVAESCWAVACYATADHLGGVGPLHGEP